METHLDRRMPSTVVELLRSRAEALPQRRAVSFLIDGEEREGALTYGELDRAARSIAHALRDVARKGDRAVLLYPPGLDFAVGFFASLYAGLVAVPAFPPDPARLGPSIARLAAVIADAKPTVLLTIAAIAEKAAALKQHAPILAEPRWISTDVLADTPTDFVDPELGSENVALLQYTSGSTALPKGVMTSHGNLLANLRQLYTAFPPKAESQAVMWVPMFHNFGLIAGLLQPIFGGFPTAFMSPLAFLEKPARWLAAVTRLRATTTGGPDFAYELCVRAIPAELRRNLRLETLDVAGSGAEPVRALTLERFTEAFAPSGFRREAFKPCYGLSEATVCASANGRTSVAALLSVSAAALKEHRVELDQGSSGVTLVSNGQTLAGQEIAIVSPETQRRSAAHEIGEIWLRGPNITAGYWARPDQTEATFGGRIVDEAGNPYLRTGDLGFLHQGELYITGRLKDLIIIRGQNHYPQDVEHTVEHSHAVVRPFASAAFAVDIQGEERLVVAAEVGPLPPAFELEPVAKAIRRSVSEVHQLEVYAIAFLQVGALPKTPGGKVMRSACRSAFLSQSLGLIGTSVLELAIEPAPSLASRQELLACAPHERPNQLLGVLRARLARLSKQELGAIVVEEPLSSLGLDSLAIVELRSTIEAELGVWVSLRTLIESPSLVALANVLAAKLGKERSGASDDADFAPTASALAELVPETELELDWSLPRAAASQELRSVFLTGATGFLGAYLLDELLRTTDAKVYCLVRAATVDAGRDKIARNLQHYSLGGERRSLERVVPVVGDLEAARLGQSEADFLALASTVDTIIHAGARVSFLYPYSALRAANVQGTRAVLELATTRRIKTLHFISTVGVLMTGEGKEPVGEVDDLPAIGSLPNGYEQSKWVADRLCAAARRRGVPVYTYRPGLISGESTTGVYSKLNEFFPCMVKGCIELQAAPALAGASLLVPVDYVSRAIVAIIKRRDLSPRTFLLNHPDPVALETLNDWLRSLGYPLRRLTYDAWKQELMASPRVRTKESALYPYLDYFLNLQEGHAETPELSAEHARAALGDLACPPLREIVRKYFEYFVKVGFLEPPRP